VLIGAMSSGNAVQNDLPSDYVFTTIKNSIPQAYAQNFKNRREYSVWVRNNQNLFQAAIDLSAWGKTVFDVDDIQDYNRPLNLEFTTVLMEDIEGIDYDTSDDFKENLIANIQNPLVNVNLQDVFGNTAFHYAVKWNQKYIVGAFLSRDDLKINLKNNAGKTAYYYAQECKYSKIIHMFKLCMNERSKKFLLATSKK
jgi:ankyrin repeat protein